MNRIGIMSLALLLTPAAALAQATPPAAPPGAAGQPMQRPDFAAMRKVREQVEQIRSAGRSQMLGALTPEHRALLASLVGQLATAPNPDPKAAAQQLDSALTPAESQAVLAAADQMRTQMRSTLEAARAQMQGSADQGAGPPDGGGLRHNGRHGERTPDAGRVLLRAVLEAPGPGRGPGGPGDAPPPN
jgi:hypothetical protein